MEITPAVEAPIKSILYYQDSSWMQCEQMELLGNAFVTEKSNATKARKYSISFDGLEPGKAYRLMFSTEINGLTITQTARDFECAEM